MVGQGGREGWVVGWLIGWLVGWLVGRLVTPSWTSPRLVEREGGGREGWEGGRRLVPLHGGGGEGGRTHNTYDG